MKISHVKIENILGVEELEFNAGQFTALLGGNGLGKTSVLEAIKACFATGHDATLLRKGAEHGEVVIVLDDGTSVRRRVREGASDTQVRRGGKIVPRPVELLRQLSDMMTLNPVEFLRATKKDRARVLLESMPIEVDAAELSKIAGFNVGELQGEPLAFIDRARKLVYDARTGTNRAVEEKRATIKQITEAMPDAPGGVEGDEDELQRRIDTMVGARDAELTRISNKLAGVESDAAAKIEKIRADLAEAIAKLRDDAAAEVEVINAGLEKTRGMASRQRELTVAKHSDEVTPLRNAKAAIAANRDAAAKRRVAQETIATMEAEAVELIKAAEAQTAALAGIDAYKAQLVEKLPIPGIEVRDGEVYRGGVVFDRLNTAQQVGIAVEIAKLRAGPLGVVCVDGIELLSETAFSEFREQALSSGLQLFVSRVTDEEELAIEADD